MIWDKEVVLEKGKEFKFKTAPVDPNDPFRGKYITLSFENTTVKVANENNWLYGESVYSELVTNEEGFAKIKSISKERPNTLDYVLTEIAYVSSNGSNEIRVLYPFDRFYMEESKAPEAETVYRKVQRDTTKITYALVSVKEGESVLKDVFINDVSIAEIVKANQNKRPLIKVSE